MADGNRLAVTILFKAGCMLDLGVYLLAICY